MSRKIQYIDLINRFWRFYKEEKIPDIDAVLYFFLLNESNSRYWENPFDLPTRKIELNLSVSRKTICYARTRLRERGLIEFTEGKGSGSAIYLLTGLEMQKPDENNDVCVSDCVSNCVSNELHKRKHKTDNETNCVSNCVSNELHKRKHKQKNTYYIKDNIKTINTTTSCCDVVVEKNETKNEQKTSKKPSSLFSEKDLAQPKQKNTKEPKEPTIPTLDEVVAYFQKVDAPARLLEWESSAQLFFDTYNADGWINRKSGRPLANWESAANNWIFYREKSEKESQTNKPTNETAKSIDRFSERRGTEPGTKARKGFKGSF